MERSLHVYVVSLLHATYQVPFKIFRNVFRDYVIQLYEENCIKIPQRNCGKTQATLTYNKIKTTISNNWKD